MVSYFLTSLIFAASAQNSTLEAPGLVHELLSKVEVSGSKKNALAYSDTELITAKKVLYFSPCGSHTLVDFYNLIDFVLPQCGLSETVRGATTFTRLTLSKGRHDHKHDDVQQ